MPSRRLALALVSLAALLGPAGASTQSAPATVTVSTFVFTGRGWGHGVGMSQWGAYGYAKRGVTYDRILSHYYPGTKLAVTPVGQVKALLIEEAQTIVVSSPDAFSVRDGRGALHDVAAGNYQLDARLLLALDPAGPPEALPGPLTFLPGKSPLWLAHPFRGTLTVTAAGKTLSVVNSVALDEYVRGVVSSEMPRTWPLEAIKAQAVAARSFALSHVRGSAFDVYADTRDQVYGGIAAETSIGDRAVAETAKQVLLYRGKVATTFFFSSSGGRTAALTDVFAGSKPTPYLVSVPDPYDTASPYHTWGPVVVGGAGASRKLGIPGLLDLQSVPTSGRAKSILVTGRNGEAIVPAGDVRRALGLRSTWIRIGVLSLARPAGTATAGASVTLTGRIEQVDGVTLEQRVAGSPDWQAGPTVTPEPDGSFSVEATVSATTDFRLAVGTAKGAVLRVAVGT